ncbi:MmpS family transport accessory protein, partial [Mycobacteroides abscessus]
MSVSRSRRVVNKIWLPTLAFVVLLTAGLAIKFAHGIFGSQDRTHSPGGNFAVVQFNPKNIVYEVFGDYGGWARVSYW